MSALRSICPICETSEKLLRCQGCMVTLYCCCEHQIADRKNHKVACNAVKKARDTLERKEQKLRALPPNIKLPGKIFEKGVGYFWELTDTRDYMRARNYLVHYLVKIKTYDAVTAAVDHAMDMIRLCRGDNLGLRFMVPALLIRLGREQQCYDFMKWHATTGRRSDYDWGNLKLPFLDVKDADVFEPVETFIRRYTQLGFPVALMLIKMKLSRDVKTLQNSFFMYDEVPLPPELVDRIRKEAIDCEIVLKRTDIFMNKNQYPLIDELDKQMQQLFAFVKDANKFFWPGLLDPEDYLAATPASYSYQSEEHAQETVKYYYEAFVETPGSLQMIKEMVDKDGRS